MRPITKEKLPPGVVPPKTTATTQRSTTTARTQNKCRANDKNLKATDENKAGNGGKEWPAKKNKKVSNGFTLSTEKQIGKEETTKKKNGPLETITPAQLPENRSVDTPTPATETITVEATSTEEPNPVPVSSGAGNEAMLMQIMSTHLCRCE